MLIFNNIFTSTSYLQIFLIFNKLSISISFLISSARVSASTTFNHVNTCVSQYGVHSDHYVCQSVRRSLRSVCVSVSMAFTQVSACVSQYGVHSGQYVCQSVWRSLRSVCVSVSKAFTQVSMCISHYGAHSGQYVLVSMRVSQYCVHSGQYVLVSMAFTQVSIRVSQYGVHSGQYVCHLVWRSLRSVCASVSMTFTQVKERYLDTSKQLFEKRSLWKKHSK